MLDLLFLVLLLVLIAATALGALYHARQLREASRGRRSLFLPPPEVARQWATRRQALQAPTERTAAQTRLRPLAAPSSEQRLCLRCGTTNLRQATHCRRCRELLAPDPRDDGGRLDSVSAAGRVSRGPVCGALLLITCASIAVILYQALRLGIRL